MLVFMGVVLVCPWYFIAINHERLIIGTYRWPRSFFCVCSLMLVTFPISSHKTPQRCSLWGNGWLSVAILTRLSAIAKFVCKAACAPSLYVAYCLLGSLVNDSWRFSSWNDEKSIGICCFIWNFVWLLDGLPQYIGYWHLNIPGWDHRPIWWNVGWPTFKTLWEILKDLKDTYKNNVLQVGNLIMFACVFLVEW